MSSQRYRDLTPQAFRDIIIQLVIKEGKSQREAASFLDIPKSVVSNVVRRYRELNTTLPGNTHANRKRVFTPTVKKKLMELFDDNETITLKDFKQGLGVEVSTFTIWKWINKSGFIYKLIRLTDPIHDSPEIINKRANYAKWYLSNSYKMTKNIIFISTLTFRFILFGNLSSVKGEINTKALKYMTNSNINILVAITMDNVVHYEGVTNVNEDVFNNFLARVVEILGNFEEFMFILDKYIFPLNNSEMTPNFTFHEFPRFSGYLNPCYYLAIFLQQNIERKILPTDIDDIINRLETITRRLTKENLKSFYRDCEYYF
ncbi:hypothetical protein RF11_02969 [Thelohanellus kitauei]|uniref:Paired domain-containing protein n=1 Tax=Thelohanellus kitauei TaxID=669202 RepID=A0A0C2MVQ6_THEKT|nr:hypothetical protein RF11_02969 [Thelohanellus kitauei]